MELWKAKGKGGWGEVFGAFAFLCVSATCSGRPALTYLETCFGGDGSTSDGWWDRLACEGERYVFIWEGRGNALSCSHQRKNEREIAKCCFLAVFCIGLSIVNLSSGA